MKKTGSKKSRDTVPLSSKEVQGAEDTITPRLGETMAAILNVSKPTLSELWSLIYAKENTFQKCKIIQAVKVHSACYASQEVKGGGCWALGAVPYRAGLGPALGSAQLPQIYAGSNSAAAAKTPRASNPLPSDLHSDTLPTAPRLHINLKRTALIRSLSPIYR